MIEDLTALEHAMKEGGAGPGLPQMDDASIMQRLLSEDPEGPSVEPEIAASIGEQMIHMDMPPLPRSIRRRIRDVCSRLNPRNAIVVGGGIGHLSAWLFDMWCGGVGEEGSPRNRPDTLRIIEQGTRFGVIIDRLIRRYDAESWCSVISLSWSEVVAESASAIAANISISPESRAILLPQPVDLVVIDLPEDERAAAASSAFELISPGGLILVQEPTVPTGDGGTPSEGEEPTLAQTKVASFNRWIGLVREVNSSHSIGFAELTGGTLVGLMKSET